MKNSAETLLWANAVLFILFGVGFMFAPTPLATYWLFAKYNQRHH